MPSIKHSVVHVAVLVLFVFGLSDLTGQKAESKSNNSGITILPITIRPTAAPAGAAFEMRYAWKSTRPTETPFKIFVHIIDDQKRMVLQADHTPPVGTSTPGWRGTITYERRFVIPEHIKDGSYRIIAGLYNDSGRVPVTAGRGVTRFGDNSFHVGTLTVDSETPWPQADTAEASSLDLSEFELTFREEFDGPLDVSAWGPGTRWIAHTPWAGDFGDARFADPGKDFPFTIKDGILCIEARKDKDGK
jgi:hypothetical protein